MKTNLTMVIHGESGAGKTYLANTAPGPRLFIDAEGGTKFLQSEMVGWNVKDEPPTVGDDTTVVVTIKNFSDLAKVYAWLQSGKHCFRSVILDSLTELQKRCFDNISGNEAPDQRAWGEVLRKMEGLVRSFRDLTLPNGHEGIDAVIIVCGSQSKEGVIRPHVQGQLGLTLPYFMDIVGYLGVTQDEEGQLMRRLLVAPLPGYVAKDRSGQLGVHVDNPTISGILDTLRGGE